MTTSVLDKGAMFQDLSQSRLLIHIAFHHTAGRETYLAEVLAAADEYPCRDIRVVIDTNSSAAAELALGPFLKLNIEFVVHDRLDDPFALTWQHRAAMAKVLGDYDYFMYLEDDMRLSARAFQRWLSDSRRLYPRGYLRGFLRTEQNAEGVLVSTDQRYPRTWRQFKLVDGEVWFYPENPYHGMWVYSAAQMQDFYASLCWDTGNNPLWGTRERAAAGMIWREDTPRTLIPLGTVGRIEPESFVDHLPNNYALNPQKEFGSIPVDELHSANLAGVLYRKLLRIGAQLISRA